MTELEGLRNSLVLTETDPSKIESIFKDIAKNLLNNFVIRNGDKLYRMVEIEFYYNLTDTAQHTGMVTAGSATLVSSFDITDVELVQNVVYNTYRVSQGN
ncbi:MAG: hypothetical protein IJ277_05285 [Bacteroidaceae bacterium]|nr:hypothetical protein [Bacteroidaceae bacterium]